MGYILVSGAAFAVCLVLLFLGVEPPLRTPLFIGVWVFGAALTVSILRYLVRGR